MYSTCLNCTRDLGSNDVLETLPIGRRVAFDPAQGRLWVVCRSCGKWNLVPFDTRLETIDACEKLFRDTRTRFSTNQIGLARTREGFDIVRIGAPQRPEFASWRYGAQYKRRRQRAFALAGAGAIAGVGILLGAQSLGLVSAGVGSALVFQLPNVGWSMVRERRRRVLATLPGSAELAVLKKPQLLSAHLDLSGREMRLRFREPSLLSKTTKTVTIAGAEVPLLARRMTAALNDLAGSGHHLDGAIRRLESGRMEDWLQQAANEAVPCKPDSPAKVGRPKERWEGFGSPAIRLAAMPAPDRLAVEMWLSEEDESRALAGELKLLERQWQQAEELARIADSLTISDHEASS